MLPQDAQCAKRCSSQFSKEYIKSVRAHCFDLSHNELDIVLLGQLIASTNTSSQVVRESRHLEKERESIHNVLPCWQDCVCKDVSLFAHNRQKAAEKSGIELKGEWSNTTCAWKLTSTAEALPVLSVSRVCSWIPPQLF